MNVLTKEGREKITAEINRLKVKREKIRQIIVSVKDFGDIAENSEFEDAKNELNFLESKIKELERILAISGKVTVVNYGEVGLGCKVKVKNNGDILTYQIVSQAEVDVSLGKISNVSPIGQALVGKKKGDTVTCQTPGGKVEYRILSIEK